MPKGNEATRIKPGQVLNPNGRPKNSLSKKEWMDKAVDDDTRRKILDVAIKKALEGKPSMIELILSRVLPPIANDDAIDIELRNKSHKERGDEIFAALSDKRITPAQAHLLFATVCDNVKLVEMTEIVERIKALETAQVSK